MKDKKQEEVADAKEHNKNEDLKIKKSSLRNLAKVHGEKAVISIARGIHDASTERISPEEEREILATFKECLGVKDLGKVSAD